MNKTRCCCSLGNDRNPKPCKINFPFPKLRFQLNERVPVIQDTAALVVDLTVCKENGNMKLVAMCRTGYVLVPASVILPFLVRLVSF